MVFIRPSRCGSFVEVDEVVVVTIAMVMAIVEIEIVVCAIADAAITTKAKIVTNAVAFVIGQIVNEIIVVAPRS